MSGMSGVAVRIWRGLILLGLYCVATVGIGFASQKPTVKPNIARRHARGKGGGVGAALGKFLWLILRCLLWPIARAWSWARWQMRARVVVERTFFIGKRCHFADVVVGRVVKREFVQ
jgi:hypothetical protein